MQVDQASGGWHQLQQGLFWPRAHLQALQRLGVEALPVQRHAGVAVQHGGALVDGGGGAEVVVRLRPLLLPQVDLPDAVPAVPQSRIWNP